MISVKTFFFVLFIFIYSNALLALSMEDVNFFKKIEEGTSTYNTYQKICTDNQSLSFLHDNEENFSNICEIVSNSDLCKNIEAEDKLNCNDISENKIDLLSIDFLWNCGTGFLTALADIFNFLLESIVWVVQNVIPSVVTERFDNAIKFQQSIGNYLAIELEKEREKNQFSVDKKNVHIAVAGNVISKLMRTIGEIITEEHKKLGCYNADAREHRICRLIGDFVMPPAFAFALAIKGIKHYRKLKNIEKYAEAARNKKAMIKATPEELTFNKIIKIFDNNKGILKDHDKGTSAFYPGRTIRAFESTSADDLVRIFTPEKGGLSHKNFDDMYWSIKSGEMHVNNKHADFIDDIHHMLDDNGPFLWKKENKVFHILEALRKSDDRWGMIKGRNASALSTEKALSLTEKNVIDRALGEHLGKHFDNRKWYHGVRNYFSPHYHRVLKISDVNNTFRKRLQLAYKADEPFDHALGALRKNKEYKFEPIHNRDFRTKIGDTGNELADIRTDIKNVYGEELTILKPQLAKDISVNAINNRITKLEISANKDYSDEFEKLYQRSNGDLDLLEGHMKKAYLGKDEFFPTKDLNDSHLQIRHRWHGALTDNKRTHYNNDIYTKKPLNPDYDVTTRWTVTVTHMKTEIKTRSVSDGKGGSRTETYTETKVWTSSYSRSRADTIPARTGEVLDNQVTPRISDLPPLPSAQTRGAHAVSASNGTPRITDVNMRQVNRIMESGKTARQIEDPYRKVISNTEAMIEDLQNRYLDKILGIRAKKEKALKRIDKEIDKQQFQVSHLREKLKLNEAEVKAIWKDDKFQDHQIRINNLLARSDHMIQRLRFTREQVLREHTTLLPDYKIPDHGPEFARLEEIHNRYRSQQAIAAGSTALVGVGAGAELIYAEENPEYDSRTMMVIDYFNELFKLDKSGTSYQDDPYTNDYRDYNYRSQEYYRYR